MMRSLLLVPSSRLFSNSCTSAGAASETQPETGAPSPGVMVSGTTSDAVVEACTVTVCFTVPRSLSSATACSPGVSPSTSSGDFPRATPPPATAAPPGSARICNDPTPAAAAAGSSMYCDVCVPPVIVIGSVRGSPAPRSSTMCDPAASVSVNGVAPCSMLSTKTCAPAGLLATVRTPVVTIGVGATAKYRRAPYVPAADSATSTAATTARRIQGRAGLDACIALRSSSSYAANVSSGASVAGGGIAGSYRGLGSGTTTIGVGGAMSAAGL